MLLQLCRNKVQVNVQSEKTPTLQNTSMRSQFTPIGSAGTSKHNSMLLLLLFQIGFARSLGVYDGMLVTSLGQQGSMLEAEYTIPETICTTGGTVGGGGGAFLPCGVTTALFDEVRAAGEVCGI